MATAARARAKAFSFRGKRKEFLEGQVENFMAAHVARETPRFFKTLFAVYWENFPWRLPIDRDPHCGMLMHDPETPAEVDLRTLTWITTQAKIKSFFWYHRLLVIRAERRAAARAARLAAKATRLAAKATRRAAEVPSEAEESDASEEV
ncbi:hypothetical protein DFH06DRAFT_1139074 [Mycena polygramma]|nr:hypothetical protein DFH06DRAFT_1139074 [Mycena polygramma]